MHFQLALKIISYNSFLYKMFLVMIQYTEYYVEYHISNNYRPLNKLYHERIFRQNKKSEENFYLDEF